MSVESPGSPARRVGVRLLAWSALHWSWRLPGAWSRSRTLPALLAPSSRMGSPGPGLALVVPVFCFTISGSNSGLYPELHLLPFFVCFALSQILTEVLNCPGWAGPCDPSVSASQRVSRHTCWGGRFLGRPRPWSLQDPHRDPFRLSLPGRCPPSSAPATVRQGLRGVAPFPAGHVRTETWSWPAAACFVNKALWAQGHAQWGPFGGRGSGLNLVTTQLRESLGPSQPWWMRPGEG